MNQMGPLSLREVADKHYAALLDELAAYLDSQLRSVRHEVATEVTAEVTAEVTTLVTARVTAEVTARVTQEVSEAEQTRATAGAQLAAEKAASEGRLAVAQARGATAESLNQAVRRLRQASTEESALSALAEITSPWSKYAVVLRVENNQLHSIAARIPELRDFSLALESAPALAGVCESRDPAIALISDRELSPSVAAAFPPETSGGRAYLFPVVANQESVAILVVAGDVLPAAVELLCESVGMRIESLEQVAESIAAALKPLPSPELVQITSTPVPESKTAPAQSWSDLSPEDQKLHLQAQRVSRVKVAEMRLYHADQLRKGALEANVYGTLGNVIDRARADFLKEFLSKSPTMVDYLHLEILRSLAHDDDRLLGPDYPGPMV